MLAIQGCIHKKKPNKKNRLCADSPRNLNMDEFFDQQCVLDEEKLYVSKAVPCLGNGFVTSHVDLIRFNLNAWFEAHHLARF